MHTKNSLQQDLINAGITPQDTLLIHSSMKSIGPVQGGADTVLDALMDYFKEQGLLVFPTLTFRLNQENPVYDVRKTYSQVGLLSDMFWKRPGVCRSLHPTHSVAAYGHDAKAFVAGHETFDSPCARTSPWGKLLDRHAKILFIGTPSIGCNTFLHGVEEWFGVPHALSQEKQRLISLDEDGIRHLVMSRRHQGNHSQFYAKMEPLFKQHGCLTYPTFGNARCFLLQCDGAHQVVWDALTQDPLLFTHP